MDSVEGGRIVLAGKDWLFAFRISLTIASDREGKTGNIR